MTVTSGTWRPGTGETSKKLAGPCEITNLKLAASGAPAVVAFYDSMDSADDLKWVLDASTTDTDSDTFEGLIFKKGVYAVLEQGANSNAIICIARRKYEATP